MGRTQDLDFVDIQNIVKKFRSNLDVFSKLVESSIDRCLGSCFSDLVLISRRLLRRNDHFGNESDLKTAHFHLLDIFMYSLWRLSKIFDELKSYKMQGLTAIEVLIYLCFRESNCTLHFIQVCCFPTK